MAENNGNLGKPGDYIYEDGAFPDDSDGGLPGDSDDVKSLRMYFEREMNALRRALNEERKFREQKEKPEAPLDLDVIFPGMTQQENDISRLKDLKMDRPTPENMYKHIRKTMNEKQRKGNEWWPLAAMWEIFFTDEQVTDAFVRASKSRDEYYALAAKNAKDYLEARGVEVRDAQRAFIIFNHNTHTYVAHRFSYDTIVTMNAPPKPLKVQAPQKRGWFS